MRKLPAALAALLALVIGLVVVAAQDRRPAEGTPVRALLVIRHFVQEGERLTANDGVAGPGGILQHYFGRRRSGDIAKLRNFDNNIRAIRRFCNWPAEVPDADRTAECPEEYYRYSIRQSAGRVIQIPVRWIPASHMPEVLGATPNVARDMRRLAAALSVPGIAPVAAEPSTDDADQLDDAPVADATGTETDGTEVVSGGDAGAVLSGAGENPPDADVLVAGSDSTTESGGGTGTTGTNGNTSSGNETGGDGDEPEPASVMPLWVGLLGYSLFGLVGLGLVITSFGRRRTPKPESDLPLDPENDPKKLRAACDSYRKGNEDLTAEKEAAEAQAAAKERERAAAVADAERARTAIATACTALHIPQPNQEQLTVRVQAVSSFFEKMFPLLGVGLRNWDLNAAYAEMSDLVETKAKASNNGDAQKKLNELAQRSVKRVLEIGRQLIAKKLENANLNACIVELEAAISDAEPDELPRDQTVVVHLNQVQGAQGTEPLPGSETSPGIGLGNISGTPLHLLPAEASKPRSTLGYEDMRPKTESEQRTVADSMPPPIPVAPLPEMVLHEADAGTDTETGENTPADGSDNGASQLSSKQPVMCGCKQEIAWFDWDSHAKSCPYVDMALLPGADEPPVSGVQETSKRKERKRRRRNSS